VVAGEVDDDEDKDEVEIALMALFPVPDRDIVLIIEEGGTDVGDDDNDDGGGGGGGCKCDLSAFWESRFAVNRRVGRPGESIGGISRDGIDVIGLDLGIEGRVYCSVAGGGLVLLVVELNNRRSLESCLLRVLGGSRCLWCHGAV
jgi:hypothetical protein